jgi:hypothetical protein
MEHDLDLDDFLAGIFALTAVFVPRCLHFGKFARIGALKGRLSSFVHSRAVILDEFGGGMELSGVARARNAVGSQAATMETTWWPEGRAARARARTPGECDARRDGRGDADDGHVGLKDASGPMSSIPA